MLLILSDRNGLIMEKPKVKYFTLNSNCKLKIVLYENEIRVFLVPTKNNVNMYVLGHNCFIYKEPKNDTKT